MSFGSLCRSFSMKRRHWYALICGSIRIEILIDTNARSCIVSVITLPSIGQRTAPKNIWVGKEWNIITRCEPTPAVRTQNIRIGWACLQGGNRVERYTETESGIDTRHTTFDPVSVCI